MLLVSVIFVMLCWRPEPLCGFLVWMVMLFWASPRLVG
ncbi:Inner membrane protein YrbG, predicted calcium/sodium:proton antiporter [Cronobacter universalis NCTC 9529]|nr:Inner membrane protein YrbG, predicted calcium/sodium:proton antiporter [Cronobacter universalis NCTC 9529]